MLDSEEKQNFITYTSEQLSSNGYDTYSLKDFYINHLYKESIKSLQYIKRQPNALPTRLDMTRFPGDLLNFIPEIANYFKLDSGIKLKYNSELPINEKIKYIDSIISLFEEKMQDLKINFIAKYVNVQPVIS